MRLRNVIFAALIWTSWFDANAQTILPVGSAPPALEFPHFPDRLHTFVWRNWSVVEPERMAKVLGTSVESVAAIADSMGLPPALPIAADQKARSYITVLRRNWHLLPYDQLLTLLDMSAEQLNQSLREDDFLFSKLGRFKPKCEPLRYASPDEAARQRATEIKRVVRETFGDELSQPAEPRFAFVAQLSKTASQRPAASSRTDAGFSLRFIYSYFALFGDSLMNPQFDPYPDGLLQRLAALGVNGVWLHTVLRDLAPSPTFPEFGAGHQVRLTNLRRLVERAGRYGIGVYLYMNEPRAMPEAFFKDRPQMKGVRDGDSAAMCTSDPAVRRWLTDSLAYIFENVPGLAGVFTITASENLTNCASHQQSKACPRCKDRAPSAIVAEVNAAIEAGVHRSNPNARVLVWDWGWPDSWVEDIVAHLPKSVWLMSVSEWSKPITRGGINTTVGEYSLSTVGPGPRAARHWALAKQAGLKTVAKVQLNNSWEISTVPYLPVMDLVAEHCRNLATAGVDGMMLSWSLGGYPSPNLEIAQRFSENPSATTDEVLDAVARDRFGPEGAPHARKAWAAFSNAFREYPFHAGVIYNCPIQVGPANLLYATPTRYAATMTGIPYDDLNRWRGPYPAEVLAVQFEKIAAGWKKGLPELEQAVEKAPADKTAEARAELGIARAAQIHFQSVANQVRFTLARDALLDGKKPLSPAERSRHIAEMKRTLADEIETARRLFTLARQDSRLGFEAANQYFYLPGDLVEKVIACRYILDRLPTR
jgi:hypothetical protein